MAGYGYEGAHTLYWLVHPFRPLLALGLTRGGSSAGHLAHIPAVPADWDDRERYVRVDSRGVVFAGEGVGWAKDRMTIWNVEKKATVGKHSGSIGVRRS